MERKFDELLLRLFWLILEIPSGDSLVNLTKQSLFFLPQQWRLCQQCWYRWPGQGRGRTGNLGQEKKIRPRDKKRTGNLLPRGTTRASSRPPPWLSSSGPSAACDTAGTPGCTWWWWFLNDDGVFSCWLSFPSIFWTILTTLLFR